MGASYSIIDSQDHGFQSFPVELVIDILLRLSLHDLTTCRRVNRTLNSIIDSSQAIQHLIDTIVAGVMDNPNSALSLSERRAALARRQKAWDTGTPQCITTGKDSDLPDVNQSGLYFAWCNDHVAYRSPPHPNQAWDDSWSHLSPLPRRDRSKIIALAVCLEENDLVAVGIQ
jgi:F-box domain